MVYNALKDLEQPARARVIDYVAKKLGFEYQPFEYRTNEEGQTRIPQEEQAQSPSLPPPSTGEDQDSEFEGLSQVALKWIRRSGLTTTGLSVLFSLGVDEIDLVAKKVPGDSKKDRMHSVLLLKGIAAYLGSGVARVTYEQLKEACLHYDAYDGSNFASYLRDFAAEASGTKGAGYTLTARGLTTATEIIKGLVNSK